MTTTNELSCPFPAYNWSCLAVNVGRISCRVEPLLLALDVIGYHNEDSKAKISSILNFPIFKSGATLGSSTLRYFAIPL